MVGRIFLVTGIQIINHFNCIVLAIAHKNCLCGPQNRTIFSHLLGMNIGTEKNNHMRFFSHKCDGFFFPLGSFFRFANGSRHLSRCLVPSVSLISSSLLMTTAIATVATILTLIKVELALQKMPGKRNDSPNMVVI